MKSTLIILFVFIISLNLIAQEKYSTKTGSVKFEASIANFEPVAAKNTATSAILKKDGSIVVLSLIKGFQFNKTLMQKHFNSKKWVDSKQFPKTKFTGTIVNFDASNIDASKQYTVKGKLTFHGVTKDIVVFASIKKSNDAISFKTNFSVKVADYGINVKSKLEAKIAEKVNLHVDLLLK